MEVFFSAKDGPISGWKDILFLAIIAGFFLDIFFLSYFGGAIISLLIIGFVLKRLLFLLKKTKNEYPVIYFVPLFVLSFIVFNLFLIIADYPLNLSQAMSRLNWVFLIEIVYNLVFAIFGFYIFKILKLYEF
ncbi:MAG: hypothetical protein AAB529_01665 [Patescibacteria group bacterium]